MNAIEPLNRLTPKPLNKRKKPKNYEAITKGVCLVMKETSKGGMMSIQNGSQAISQLIIEFEEHIEQQIN